MKLHIWRNQKQQTGLFGGHKGMVFTLGCRVDLSPEETQLITRYKAEEHPLLTRTDSTGNQIPTLTVRQLMQGVGHEVKDVTELLREERLTKEACQNFKTLLEVMNTFGGEEVIEI